MKKFLIPIFIAICLVQWWVPSSMIFKKEKILKRGTAFRFLTEPVDPSDPFKGKYITLNFNADTFRVQQKNNYSNGQEVYVGLIKDDSGYVKISSLQESEPTGTADFLKVKISYIDYDDQQLIHFEFPFDKYYMDEYKAPRAETLYRESTRQLKNKTYALVKVLNGEAVTEDVLINDTSIHKLITY